MSVASQSAQVSRTRGAACVVESTLDSKLACDSSQLHLSSWLVHCLSWKERCWPLGVGRGLFNVEYKMNKVDSNSVLTPHTLGDLPRTNGLIPSLLELSHTPYFASTRSRVELYKHSLGLSQ